MTAKPGIDEELLTFPRFSEFKEEDARGEIVDVGDAEGDEGGGEFGGDDADVEG